MSDASDCIADGSISYGQAIGDPQAITEAAGVLRLLGASVGELVHPTDTVRLAWASMIIRPDIRTQCLAMVLEDRVLIAWRKGVLRRNVEHEVFLRSAVSDVRVMTGTDAAVRGVQLLAITHDGRDTLLGLPQANAGLVASVIRNAIIEPTGQAGEGS